MDALLDALPLPSLLVEGDLVTAANEAFGALVGIPARDVVGRRYAEFLAPQDRERVGARQLRRLAGSPVPSSYEVTLAGASGPVPVELRLHLFGTRFVVQILDRREEASRRELLASLARLGADVQRELSEDAIQRRVREGLLALGIRSVWVVRCGDDLRLSFVEMGPGPERAMLEAALGKPLEGYVAPPTPLADRVWTDGARFTDEWPNEAERWFGVPVAEALLRLPPEGAYHRAIGVRADAGGAPAGMLFAVGGWLRPQDVPAFQLFGSQVGAALEAARRLGELRARNHDLRALNGIADAAANAPDFRAFLARAEEVVREATGCNAFGVLLMDASGVGATLVHESRFPPGVADVARRGPSMDERRMDLIRHGGTLVGGQEDFVEGIASGMRAAGVGTAVAVPLRFRSGVLGVLVVDYVGPRRDAAAARVDLLQAMAPHFAAAVETHRLLDDLRRRVGELTLLNDVAVATGALDPARLLDSALRRISATLDAPVAGAHLWTGGDIETVSLVGCTREQFAGAPGGVEASLAVRAAASKAPLRLGQDGNDLARRRWFRDRLGIDALVGVPLLAKDRAVGSLVLGRPGGRDFDDAEVRLLSAVGVQLGMAVEHARLFAETRRRIADLEAVNGLALRVFTTAPGDAQVLLEESCREVAAALDAAAAVILRLDGDGKRLRGVAGWGPPVPASRISIDLDRTPIAAEALRTQAPVWAPDAVLFGGAGAATDHAPRLSVLFVPLTSRDATRGLVAIADAPDRRFGEAEIALAYALASEAAMGAENAELYAAERRRVEELSRLNEENARLYEDLRASYAELARAQEQLIQQERLAALGQLAAVVAHEVRNPLGVIFNSLGTLRRLVQPQGDARMLFDIVGEEADRLNRMVGDLLDFARPATPRLRAERIDQMLDDAAAAALRDARGVRLERDVPAGLPPVPMDGRLMRQALVNVIANAVQSMPDGGTLRVGARRDGRAVRIEIADTGCGIPEEVRHRIFDPFFTTRPTGTGLGLAVVKRILDDHRAAIEVHSVEGGGTRFTFRLPLDEAAGAPQEEAS